MKGLSGLKTNINVGMDVGNKKTVSSGVKARLIKRVYITSPYVTSAAVPYGSKYCVASAVGAGGSLTTDNAVPSTGSYVGSGGAAFAQRTFTVNNNQTLTLKVGDRGLAAETRISRVIAAQTVVVEAAGGGNSNLADNGFGGDAAACIGDVKVSGTAPPTFDAGYFGGGLVVGDSVLDNSVGAFANGVIALKSSPTEVVTAPRFGGGGAIFYNGSGSTGELSPATGLIVLEYWDGDPR
jgi:hypothetical protein